MASHKVRDNCCWHVVSQTKHDVELVCCNCGAHEQAPIVNRMIPGHGPFFSADYPVYPAARVCFPSERMREKARAAVHA